MKKLLPIMVCIGVLACGGNATATVLTFDDLPDIVPSGFEPVAQIASYGAYGGLTWSNMYYGDPLEMISYYGVLSSGYSAGITSAKHIAFNGFGNNASVYVTDGTFDFNSVYLTGAWIDDLNVTVEGWLDGTQLYKQTVIVDAYGPTMFTFNYIGIDQLIFVPSGGVDAGYGIYTPDATNFVMDNFTYNTPQVPEPSTLLLLGSGLVGLVGFRRKSKK